MTTPCSPRSSFTRGVVRKALRRAQGRGGVESAPVLHVWESARPTLNNASELAVSAIFEQPAQIMIRNLRRYRISSQTPSLCLLTGAWELAVSESAILEQPDDRDAARSIPVALESRKPTQPKCSYQLHLLGRLLAVRTVTR